VAEYYSTPFQSVCVLLAVETPDRLAMIPSAIETLKNITTIHDSHLSQEAVRTAQNLVRGAREKKSRELASLDQGLAIVGEIIHHPGDDLNDLNNGIEWPTDMAFGDYLDLSDFYGICS